MVFRLICIVIWAFIALIALPVACYQKRVKLWNWAYYFDNEEDGYDGSKGTFYSEYLGLDISKQHWLKKAWIAYKWSVWRNPCFNLRYHPWVGVDITNPEIISFKGNTYHHEQKWSLEPNKRELKWYKLKAKYDGKVRRSWFYLIPVFGDKYLYLRFGLKVYPANYLDKWWLEKIKKEGWPEYKDKGLTAFTIRLR